VQTNYGGFLTLNGAPVGRALAQFPYQEALAKAPPADDREDGSIMIVLATDAPLSALGLERIAKRVMMGLGRTGSYAHNGSGDYIIAFSTAPELRKPRESRTAEGGGVLVNAALSPLFAAAAEATEEAVYNALFMATTVRSARGELKAISIPAVLEVLEAHNALGWNQRYAPGAP